MSHRLIIYPWKNMPFIRLLIPLIAGILLQFFFSATLFNLLTFSGFIAFISIIFYLLPFSLKYTFRWTAGVAINLSLVLGGALLVYKQDISNKNNWIGNFKEEQIALLATIEEPLISKAKTFKAEASVKAVYFKGEWTNVTGRILIYFSKEGIPSMNYGSRLLFYKPWQQIKNAGNPGSFDYKRYTAFHDIFHQVFLKPGEYTMLPSINEGRFNQWLLSLRSGVIKILQQYIKPPREAGVAEALLIGYREDLDKALVQAYSNTGVVHIIAISGLHLGMIYLAMLWLMKPFKKTKWIRWVKPIIILTVLWLFTLLAGAVPSILRSAVMFSFIIVGETLNRKSSIYNTLALSAFVMLCINPYYLWDIGFQLSYAAVVSIIIFSKPVYNWYYFKNKLLDFFWQLASVTISAQVFTVPIILYAFHQFPTVFLLTNCIIVPLSSVVLFAELALLMTSFIPVLANFTGFITGRILEFMNDFIEKVNRFPYAVFDGIQNTLAETFLLYLFICCACVWLLRKTKPALFVGLASLFALIVLDAFENYASRQQHKMIVYNILQHSAIDFIAGKHYAFTGDTSLQNDSYLRNFHLKPSRTLYRIRETDNLDNLYISHPFVQVCGKRIVIMDKPFKFQTPSKITVDAIVIAHNPKVNIAEIAAVFNCNQYIFDGSNSTWKIRQWKKDCDSLHLRNYSTSDMGAYIMSL